jgi:hypothetical protein
MSTNAQVTANRENAIHSTGPTTEAGKSTSSRNGVKHGLASARICTDWENREDYLALQSSLIEEYKPTTTTEELLVRDMAKFHWLTDRAITMQTQEIEKSFPNVPASLALLMRYQTTNYRAYHKALSTLLTIRKECQKAEIGFASQKLPKPAPKLVEPITKTAKASSLTLGPTPTDPRFDIRLPSGLAYLGTKPQAE